MAQVTAVTTGKWTREGPQESPSAFNTAFELPSSCLFASHHLCHSVHPAMLNLGRRYRTGSVVTGPTIMTVCEDSPFASPQKHGCRPYAFSSYLRHRLLSQANIFLSTGLPDLHPPGPMCAILFKCLHACCQWLWSEGFLSPCKQCRYRSFITPLSMLSFDSELDWLMMFCISGTLWLTFFFF